MLDRTDMQFLYRDGDDYVFMDTESYEQQTRAPRSRSATPPTTWSSRRWRVIAFYNDDIVTVEIPASVELAVAETEPGIQGDRVSGARKPATLETGKVVQVPLFINIGDRLRVDTRSGDYITRV